MEKRKILTFLNCYFCSKTLNIEELIEMNTNSLFIGSETVDFCEIILDVCFFKVNIEMKRRPKLKIILRNFLDEHELRQLYLLAV